MKFHTAIEEEKSQAIIEDASIRDDDFKLSSYVVTESSRFLNKSIRESGIREHFRGMVVGIERNAERVLGPTGGFQLKENDLLWIVSDRKQI